MKKSIKIPLYIFFFMIFFLVGFPKENLYYYIEKQLKKSYWVVSSEHIENKLFSFDVKEGYVTHKGDAYAHFETTGFTLLGLQMENVFLYDPSSKRYFASLENLELYYSIMEPKVLLIKGSGKIGEVKGQFDLLSNKLTVSLQASKYMKKNLRKTLNTMKLKDGRYYYESKL